MSLADTIFTFVFRVLGIHRRIAKDIMRDPAIKSEVEKLQESMRGMEAIIRRREALQRKKDRLNSR